MPAADPADLLAAALRHDPSRPLITFYDDATGERIELSVATTANWVAKTANLLDDLGVAAGEPVHVSRPLHWQAAVALLAVWTVGARPVWEPADGEAELGGPDFAAEVIGQPDVFVATGPSSGPVSHSDLPAGSRVLSTLPYSQPAGVDLGLLAPLAAGGSVVLVAEPDPAALSRRCAAERVTATAGVDVPGLPRLDG